MRLSRRQFTIAAGGSLALASTPALLERAGLAAEEPIRVGNVLDQTGGLNIYSLKQIKALAIAVDEFDQAGGLLGRPLELVFSHSSFRAIQKIATIRVRVMSAENEVRSASERFYAALNRMLNGDAGPMAEAWSHGATVTTMHPIGGREAGWKSVEESWTQVAKLATGGHAQLSDQLIQVVGDLAYEVGIEKGQVTLAGKQVAIKHRVTNVYRREGGAWKVVDHHTDESPAIQDLLRGLQAKQ